ncbi:MAG: hypothetical protein JO002_05505, partial [Burkholderiaceae bacterium]|nr:hypothetical protein [Burkholderiaceae bacterium]
FMFAMGDLTYLALPNEGWFFSAFYALWNFLMIIALIRQAPWSPFYQGPTLVVDSVGIQAGKWSATWEEIEKFDIAGVARHRCIAVYKKGLESEKQPHTVNGPLGASLQTVLEYLNARLEAPHMRH